MSHKNFPLDLQVSGGNFYCVLQSVGVSNSNRGGGGGGGGGGGIGLLQYKLKFFIFTYFFSPFIQRFQHFL